MGEKYSWTHTRPFVFLDSDQTETTFELDHMISPEVAVVVFNVKATGYFRVNYDEASWRRIAETLKKDKKLIHPLNRKQILYDLMALAKFGKVSKTIVDLFREVFPELNDPKEKGGDYSNFRLFK